jgi:hypothetical protein
MKGIITQYPSTDLSQNRLKAKGSWQVSASP